MGFVMPLFQLESSNTLGSMTAAGGLNSGTLSSCENRNQAANGLKQFNLTSSCALMSSNQNHHSSSNKDNHTATTINSRLNSSHKINTTNENLHLSSALSEVNFKAYTKTSSNHNQNYQLQHQYVHQSAGSRLLANQTTQNNKQPETQQRGSSPLRTVQ